MPSDSLLKNNYEILHDTGKTLCFVTTGSLSRLVYTALTLSRQSRLISFEEAKNLDDFDRYQYICLTSDIRLKQDVVDFLESQHCDFFSVIHKSNSLHDKIGRGTFVNGYNQGMLGDRSRIGNHCVIATHSLLSHDCVIDDFCHVSSFAFLASCHLQPGCCLGTRVSVFYDLYTEQIQVIPKYTNIISGSMITKPIIASGTYVGNRKISSETSLNKRIV